MSWAAAAKVVVDEGFSYSVSAERIWRAGHRNWMRATISGNTIEAPLPRRSRPKVKQGQFVRVFLASTFWPGNLAYDLRDLDKGILIVPQTYEFSAKGQVVRIIGDFAVVDCGVFILCELVPAYFIKEEQQRIRRDLKPGDTIIETGGLSFRFADEALQAAH